MGVKEFNTVGHSVKLRDLETHVRGQTRYYEDANIQRLLHLKMHRSSQPHAEIVSVDTSQAEKAPGVVCVLTHEDLPGQKKWTPLAPAGVGPDDEPVLAFDKVRWKGEPIVAVIAETPQEAQRAAGLVKVTYKELPAVMDVEEALKPGAPNVTAHWPGNHYIFPDDHAAAQIRYGDVEKAFAAADHIVEGMYQTRPIEQAPLETTGCIAEPDGNGRYTIHSNTQMLYFTLDTVAGILNMPAYNLRFVGGTVGGGFGGKVDMQTEPIATLAAIKTGRAVKYKYTREEEMKTSSTRAAWRLYVKDGVMNDGRVIARKITSFKDSGAYLRFSSYGAMKQSAHLPGPYTVPNVWADIKVVFTNRTPSSAMRGYAIMPASFAIEMQMTKAAKLIGMDPWRFRLLNAYRHGDERAHRRPVKDAALVETIQAAARISNNELADDCKAMTSWDREAG